MGDALHMKPSDGPCEVHELSTQELTDTFVERLRESHGKGGTNVCRERIDRMKQEADRRRKRT